MLSGICAPLCFVFRQIVLQRIRGASLSDLPGKTVNNQRGVAGKNLAWVAGFQVAARLIKKYPAKWTLYGLITEYGKGNVAAGDLGDVRLSEGLSSHARNHFFATPQMN